MPDGVKRRGVTVVFFSDAGKFWNLTSKRL